MDEFLEKYQTAFDPTWPPTRFRLGGAEDNFIFYIKYCLFFCSCEEIKARLQYSKAIMTKVWLWAHFPRKKHKKWPKYASSLHKTFTFDQKRNCPSSKAHVPPHPPAVLETPPVPYHQQFRQPTLTSTTTNCWCQKTWSPSTAVARSTKLPTLKLLRQQRILQNTIIYFRVLEICLILTKSESREFWTPFLLF